jgi:predicted deacylase
MSDFELSGLTARRGSVVRGTLGEVTLAAGAKVGVPVVVVNGDDDGPTLVATGSMHGEEIVGCGALIATLRALDPAQVRGTLIAVTVANPLALVNNTYVTPYDDVNLCGPLFWPPSPNGSLTQRLASFISPALQRADYYLDLHSNSAPATPMVMTFLDQCRDAGVEAETRRIADAFGFTPVDMPGHPEAHDDVNVFGSPSGYPAAVAVKHGIPALQPELVGNPTLSHVDLGRIGVMNVMRAIGMLDGELEPQPQPRVEGDWVYFGALVNEHGGLLWPRHEPGTLLRAGDVAAEITDVWGETVEEIAMPVDGWIWAHPGGYFGKMTHAVPEGTMVGFVAHARG